MDIATSSLKISSPGGSLPSGELRLGDRSASTPVAAKSPLEVLFVLGAAFPACFAVYEARRKPLKRGIRDDLIAVMVASGGNTITEKELGAALGYYCQAKGYLRELKAGRSRIDLDGNPDGVVTAAEQKYAEFLLVFQQKKQEQRAKRLNREQKETIKRGDGVASLKAAWKARRGGGQ
jgi:sRNA-binding protein